MPHPRSTTDDASNARTRAARCVATDSRVACSSPSGVKYIRAARSPNLVTAARRSAAWESATASRSGAVPGVVRRSDSCAASGSSVERVAQRDGRRQDLLAVVGQQPAERVEVHRLILSEPGGPLALRRVEC